MRWGLVGFILFVLVACYAGRPPVSPLPFRSPLAREIVPTLPDGLVYRLVRMAPTSPLHKLNLPLVMKPGECGMGVTASQLADLFVHDPNQQRVQPVCNIFLVKAAQRRADDMQARRYFNHTDPDGHTPNFWARTLGCNLPGEYPDEGNQIESIALNYPTAKEAWTGWLNSAGHRVHVLGEIQFFSDQRYYGFGYSVGNYGIVYVLMSSKKC